MLPITSFARLIVLGSIIIVPVSALTSTAMARVFVGVGVGVPLYAPYYPPYYLPASGDVCATSRDLCTITSLCAADTGNIAYPVLVLV
jgi:hypothetical protein